MYLGEKMPKSPQINIFPGEDLDTGNPASDTDGGDGENRIRCPICGWEPSKTDLWSCHCGHLWNTFDTGGVCPACLLQWAYTACPACRIWSRHADWYQYS